MTAITCRHCGGPMPPPASTGRPAVYCSYSCRRNHEYAVARRRWEERERRERPKREAEWQARRRAQEEEATRRREQEYQRAIQAGGDVAAEARWQRLYDETLDSTGSRYGLCQWALDNGQPGACTRRTADVYCATHNRQLEREAEKRRRERADG
jgi:uncharacterized Zn finger protein (UPF0148 family)